VPQKRIYKVRLRNRNGNNEQKRLDCEQADNKSEQPLICSSELYSYGLYQIDVYKNRREHFSFAAGLVYSHQS
jgi:hypothetical protein